MLERFTKRPLSHSQLSAWEYDKAEWFDRYVLGKTSPPTPNMVFGSKIGDAIGTDDSPIPELNPPGVKEYPVRSNVEGIECVGFIDHFCPDTLELHENKTSDNPKRWSQKKADTHTQIDMYLLLLYLQDGIPPEHVTAYLNFIQTRPTGLGYRLHKEPKWKQYKLATKTMADLDRYTEYVVSTVEAMHKYIEERSQVSTPAPSAPVFKGV